LVVIGILLVVAFARVAEGGEEETHFFFSWDWSLEVMSEMQGVSREVLVVWMRYIPRLSLIQRNPR
jgi:hypothetical protein